MAIIVTIFSAGYRGKTVDMEQHSHLKRKQDYGHQMVGVLLSCNGITLPYRMILYDKTVSKIDIAANIAEELPAAPNPSYLLCDSWYVCETVMDAFLCKGFYTIGALKTNRILFPYGARLSVSDFAQKYYSSNSANCPSADVSWTAFRA